MGNYKRTLRVEEKRVKDSVKDIEIFFALLRAGLWEKEVQLSSFGEIDFAGVKRLAEEQSVVGLIAAGVDHLVDMKPAKKDVLQFIGQAMQLEQRNTAMNRFIAVLVDKMRKEGICAILVKGQGIAQCYEHPLWRACGDVDLFLSDDNYDKAKAFLSPFATSIELEGVESKHLGMTISQWVVELHGRLYCGLSSRIDKQLDDVYNDSFFRGKVRLWKNGEMWMPLLAVENDVFYVFTHILQHFYKGGIGLRQICDWCRLLWTYRDSIDVTLLEQRLRRAKLMTEWKAFGAFAVNYLGMPVEAMPLYDENDSHKASLKRKANRICDFVMMSGNFGHNRDMSYYSKYPYVIRKCFSMSQRIGDLIRHARIFPLNSLRFFPKIMFDGVRSAVRGE